MDFLLLNQNDLTKYTMDKNNSRYIILALSILDDDINPTIMIPFFNNKKFKISYIYEYLIGMSCIVGDYHDNFMNVILHFYIANKKRNSKNGQNTMNEIKKLSEKYQPFMILINAYHRKQIKRDTIHKMLFNIDRLCQGDVYIYGYVLSLIDNDLCKENDYECISMLYTNSKSLDKFLLRMTEEFDIYTYRSNTTTIIFIKGIPRILQLYQVDDVDNEINIRIDVKQQIYLDKKSNINKTYKYENYDKYNFDIGDIGVGIKHNKRYFQDIMKSTNNLENIWDAESLVKVLYDYREIQKNYTADGHLYY